MSRVALLPSTGDPFVLQFWLNAFEKYGKAEVDAIKIDINSPSWMPAGVSRIVAEQHAIVASYNTVTNHGKSITRLVSAADDFSHIVLLEDDAPLLRAGSLDEYFRAIESNQYDLVGSPRLSGSKIIWDETIRKYGLSNQPAYDQGPNWWPCFFFARRSDLMRTDMNFSARGWAIGERIEQLDITAQEPIGGDTMVWMSIQLRGMGLRCLEIPQHHSYCSDLQFRPTREHIWAANCPWLHIGSLSVLTGMAADQCMFAPHDECAAYLDRLKVLSDSCKSTKEELTRRYAWVRLIYDRTKDDLTELGDLRYHYLHNLNMYTERLGLDAEHMQALIKAYGELV